MVCGLECAFGEERDIQRSASPRIAHLPMSKQLITDCKNVYSI